MLSILSIPQPYGPAEKRHQAVFERFSVVLSCTWLSMSTFLELEIPFVNGEHFGHLLSALADENRLSHIIDGETRGSFPCA